MKTLKLYEEKPYLINFEATVLSCIKKEDIFEIILDKTCFFPGGGGQESDKGNLANLKVVDIYEKDDIIVHILNQELNVGSVVSGEIEWDHRYTQMQNHSGEHVVSGLIHKLFNFNNVGFHMDETQITIDIDGELNLDNLEEIELKGNKIIENALEISCFYPNANPNANPELQFRSKKEIEGDIRVVSIPNVDSCACCGIHLRNTREIGLIKILSFNKHRGGTRINLVCGKSAFQDYYKKHNNVVKISQLLSSKPQEIDLAVESLINEKYYLKEENQRLLSELLKIKASLIIPKEINILFEKDLDSYNIGVYSKLILENTPGIVCIFSGDNSEFKFIIASKDTNCQPIFEKLKSNFEVKGGGKLNSIQGTIKASKENIINILNQ